MISKLIPSKGILAKLLEKGISILLFKECNKIGYLKIDLFASSIQIIKGEIKKIRIIAKDINYKDLLFDKIEIESSQIKIDFDLRNKDLNFKNIPIIKFEILISENSLKNILLYSNWNQFGNIISKQILNQEKLTDLKIKDDQLLIKASHNNFENNKLELINIKTEKGKVYLNSKNHNKTIQIPFEDKIFIKNVNIENNFINIVANSSVSF